LAGGGPGVTALRAFPSHGASASLGLVGDHPVNGH